MWPEAAYIKPKRGTAYSCSVHALPCVDITIDTRQSAGTSMAVCSEECVRSTRDIHIYMPRVLRTEAPRSTSSRHGCCVLAVTCSAWSGPYMSATRAATPCTRSQRSGSGVLMTMMLVTEMAKDWVYTEAQRRKRRKCLRIDSSVRRIGNLAKPEREQPQRTT